MQPIPETVPDLRYAVEPGFADAIDEVAAHAFPTQQFFRKGWYAGLDPRECATLIVRRADGTALAAIPSMHAGPPLLGARSVPGAYWPYRGFPVRADVTDDELLAILTCPFARDNIGSVLRIGPLYADDPFVRRFTSVARKADFTVLTRRLGTTYVLDIPGVQAEEAWPRTKTMRKVRAYERQLAQIGALEWKHVCGDSWEPRIFDDLMAIERNCWIARETDLSGAKFMLPAQRSLWENAVADPALADMLSATILYVGGVPAGFSFDLNIGHIQHGIAGAYDERFAKHSVGKVVSYRHMEQSMGRGISIIDWGAGDSGYKREIGAEKGSEIIDLLFVRSRMVASMLRQSWQRPLASDEETGKPVPDTETDGMPKAFALRLDHLVLASLATAATAVAFTE